MRNHLLTKIGAGLVWTLAGLTGLGLPAKAWGSEKISTIAVLDLTPVGAPADLAQNLTQIAAVEVGRYQGVRSITRAEIANLIGLERQKVLLGCTDESCIAQGLGALGIEKILSGQIGEVEKSFVLTVQLVDVNTARVEARTVRLVGAGTDGLIDATRSAITDLMSRYVPTNNQPPRLSLPAHLVAHRGDTVWLDASRCYDPDGDPLRFLWRQVEGPAAVLERAQNAQARFRPDELGEYRFLVNVTDGRSKPLEQGIEVRVLERRPYRLGLGVQAIAPFNRLIETDQAGNYFRNRVPVGPMLDLGLQLTDRISLTGELAVLGMHIYPEDNSLESVEWMDYLALDMLLGVKLRFPFEGFDLWFSPAFGSSRRFLSPHDRGVYEVNVRSQAIAGEVTGGLDVPFGERFGASLKVGLAGQVSPDRLAPFREGISFAVARDGLLWGFSAGAAAYARF